MISNLQIIRGMAALAVVVFHSGFTFFGQSTMFQAVDVFFVVSGFIMAKVAPNEGRQFLRKRIARIVPAYWFVTIVSFYFASAGFSYIGHKLTEISLVVSEDPTIIILWLTHLNWEAYGWSVLTSLLFIPEIVDGAWVYPFVGSGWSLNFEMFFYALFAAAIFVSPSAASKLVVLALIAVLVLSKALRGVSPVLDFYGQTYLLQFAGGIVAYHILEALPPSFLAYRKFEIVVFSALTSVLLFVCGALPWLVDVLFGYASQTVAALLPFLLVLSWLMMSRAGLDYSFRPLNWLGDISYALYLVHLPVIVHLQQVQVATGWEKGGTAMLALTIAVSIPLAYLLHVKVEKPAMKFGRRRLAVQVAASG